MKRIWEYIADVLEQTNEVDLAVCARRLDRIYVKIYGNMSTDLWKNNYRTIEKTEKNFTAIKFYRLNFIYGILLIRDYYCFTNTCDSCEFGRYSGICYDKDSLVSQLREQVYSKIKKETIKNKALYSYIKQGCDNYVRK